MVQQERERDGQADSGLAANEPVQATPDVLGAEVRALADRYELPSSQVAVILRRIQQACTELDDGQASWANGIFLHAAQTLGAAKAVELFEREDLCTFVRRDYASYRLWGVFLRAGFPEEPRVDQLIHRTEVAIRELDEHRERLVKDGVGWAGSRWLDRNTDLHDELLLSLYPIKPYWLTTSRTGGDRRGETERVPGTETLTLTCGSLMLPAEEVVVPSADPSSSRVSQGGPSEECPSRSADGSVEAGDTELAWLDRADAARLEAGRATLLDLKIAILRHVVRSLRERDATGLWPGCVSLLASAVTATDSRFYARLDSAYSDARVLPGDLAGSLDVLYYHQMLPLGRLTDLLAFVGHCEAELRLGIATWAARHLPKEAYPFGGFSYFEALGQPWQADLDAALDRSADLIMSEQAFWTDLGARITHALAAELDEEVVIRQRVKSPHAAGFAEHLRAYAELGNSYLKRTGALPPLPLPAATGHPSLDANVFRKEGEYWTIVYRAGKPLRLRDAVGLAYIASLLRTPGKDRLAADLVAELNPATPSPVLRVYAGMSREQLMGEGLSIGGLNDNGELIDGQARRSLNEARAELQKELDEAEADNDIERQSQLREQIDWLETYLAGGVGLTGRARKAGDPNENIRRAVSNAIDRSLKRIEEKDPTLGHHLRRAIRKGVVCSYTPDQLIEWDL
jgi:hypothetical protein